MDRGIDAGIDAGMDGGMDECLLRISITTKQISPKFGIDVIHSLKDIDY